MTSKPIDTHVLPSLTLQLQQVIDHLEILADKPGALLEWGKEMGETFEDEAERLNDLSARIAVAHRPNTPSSLVASTEETILKVVANNA